MPILKSSNEERFLLKVRDPVASNCLLPQDCTRDKDEVSVLFN